MATYIIMVGDEPDTAVPVHNIDGTLGRWDNHSEAAHAARQLVTGRITDKGAFVCALHPTAFYLPVPPARAEALNPPAEPVEADETIVDPDAIDKKESPN